MKAVLLKAYNKNIIRAMLGLSIEERKVPKPDIDEVIIKVHASPVNPSDIAFIQGSYNIVKSLPAIPGFEASGIIVDSGDNKKHLIGKKASCFIQGNGSGTWSEYMLAKIDDIIILNDDMNMDQAACFTVNPFTAWGILSIAIAKKARAIIQNASGGQVAAFIRELAHDNNIDVIDIVRKEKTSLLIKHQGARNVLVETDEDFINNLREVTNEFKPTVAYDAVGGKLAGQMFNSLAKDGEIVVYGGLSGKNIIDVNTMDIIFDNKTISGFNLIDWKDKIGKDEFNRISDILQKKIISGSLQTNISAEISYDNIVKGLRTYISDMSNGKLLIVPNNE
ncbi:MAG: zinc-binding dehydrogenase [Bacteroidales bacterium]|nr:zinc-binding dehydrogenase [Bacteroidales bacterium]